MEWVTRDGGPQKQLGISSFFEAVEWQDPQ